MKTINIWINVLVDVAILKAGLDQGLAGKPSKAGKDCGHWMWPTIRCPDFDAGK
ncbi:MAG: hypothetical protein OXD45_02435 [Rhodobacteraceae bacterium]|nr:hypothetical protein [Paracoccaceae bacterium]